MFTLTSGSIFAANISTTSPGVYTPTCSLLSITGTFEPGQRHPVQPPCWACRWG